ncbi:MAG: MarR family winged helix-turn-helix transcriptional regulator [Acidimicrobiia bacterium]
MEAKISDKTDPVSLVRDATRVLARLSRVIERGCQDVGLSLPQYRLLIYVSLQTQRAGQLANMAAVSRPALTDLVDGLERQELLKRVPVLGDRRGIGLELTEAGAAKIDETEQAIGVRLEIYGIPQKTFAALADLAEALDRELAKKVKDASLPKGPKITKANGTAKK